MSASISSSVRRWPSLVNRVTPGARYRSSLDCACYSRREIALAAGEARLDRDLREILGGQRVAVAVERGAEQHAGELADVAGPAVRISTASASLPIDRARCRALLGEAGEAGGGRARDVAAAVAKRRQLDHRDRDPLGRGRLVEALRQRPARVAITRTSTDELPLQPTGRTSPVASTRSRRSCVSRGKAADLVEDERSAVASSIRPISRRTRRGRRPFRDRTTRCRRCWRRPPCSRRDQRAAGAKACGVDCPARQSPCRYRFADDQHRQAVASGLGGNRERGAKSGAAPTNCSSDRAGASFSDNGAARPPARRRSALAASASSSRSGATGLTR